MAAGSPRQTHRRRNGTSSGATRTVRPRAWGRLFGCAVKAMLVLSAGGALVAALVWVDPVARFKKLINRPIASVTIEGEFEYLSQQQARQLLAGRVSKNFLQLDMAALKSTVEESPWVENATISRQWPDRLVVRIQEQQPIARWGKHAFVNMRGDIIDVHDNSMLSHLPLLHGSDRHAKDVMQKYVQIARLLAPAELALEAVHLDDTLSWSLQLQGGMKIKIGREQVFEKLQRLLDVFPQGLSAKVDKIASIDLRYDNGFAVAWKETGLEQVAVANRK